jgi:hypothetical protein
MLKMPTAWKRYFKAKFTDFSRQVSPSLILGVSGGYCQRALVGESGNISRRKAQ